MLCQSRRGIRLQSCLKILKESGLAQPLLTNLQSEGLGVLGFRVKLERTGFVSVLSVVYSQKAMCSATTFHTSEFDSRYTFEGFRV